MADYVAECMHRRTNDKAVVRHRPRRIRSARLAQEAEGAGGLMQFLTFLTLAPGSERNVT
jgi:hypothetical protein